MRRRRCCDGIRPTERDGATHYTTDRIVEEFGILAAKGMPG